MYDLCKFVILDVLFSYHFCNVPLGEVRNFSKEIMMQYTPYLYCGDIIVCLVSMGHKRCVGDRSKVTSFFLDLVKNRYQQSRILKSNLSFIWKVLPFIIITASIYLLSE